MNKIFLIGRITADPELKYTNTNVAVVGFNIATDRGFGEKKTTDFVPTKAFGKTAELIGQYLVKGSKVAIEGNLQTRNYEDKNGQKRFAMEVVVDKIEFLSEGKKKDESKVTPEEIDQQKESDPFAEFGNMVELDNNFLD